MTVIPAARLALIRTEVWPAMQSAFGLLPVRMNTREARVLMLAIGLQESRFTHRAQVVDGGGKGPARGWWQFELGGGCAGVLRHPASSGWMAKACAVAGIEPTARALWEAIETDDVLAAVAARLLLFTDPRSLPPVGDPEAAWKTYLWNWRPGKPHRHTWDQLYADAIEADELLAENLPLAAATVSPSPAPVAAHPSADPGAGAATTVVPPQLGDPERVRAEIDRLQPHIAASVEAALKERKPVSDFDWKGTVRAIAPTLAGAFGGPLAGLATKVLGDALLGDGNASEEALAQAVAGLKPEDYLRLKDAERAYKQRLEELGVEVYKTDQADRVSARTFWKALVPSERGLLFGLGFAVLALFGYAVWWTLNPDTALPTDAARLTLIGAVIGYTSAKADQVISFFFGSSSDSRKKTDQLGDALSSMAKR